MHYVSNEIENIQQLFDIKAGQWNKEIGNELYELAKRCYEYYHIQRLNSHEALCKLETLRKKVIL